MSIVYILTNESMPEVIKIGVTDNLEQRIKQLDNTSVPLPFECYYAVEVSDAASIEKKMHQGLSENRIRQNREFFNVAPESAKSLLEIAEVMGGKNVTPKEDIVETPQDKQALERAKERKTEEGKIKIIYKLNKRITITNNCIQKKYIQKRNQKTETTLKQKTQNDKNQTKN